MLLSEAVNFHIYCFIEPAYLPYAVPDILGYLAFIILSNNICCRQYVYFSVLFVVLFLC